MFIVAQIVISVFQFMFSYQQYDKHAGADWLGIHSNTYVTKGNIIWIKSTVSDLKESIGMMFFACMMMIFSLCVALGCSFVNLSYYKFYDLCKEYERVWKECPRVEEMIAPGVIYNQEIIYVMPTVPTI